MKIINPNNILYEETEVTRSIYKKSRGGSK